jgi:hypothetical protein
MAALNHPNIAAIYGLEDSAIVMELVDGPTLADRLAAGALPLDEAMAIAKQMADALSAAHEAGIIHRDLKPANIKIRPDGTVKVLDFGLAKALEPVGGTNANVTNSPTLSVHATQQGLILGTAAYMAPEQARGRAVDRRADIWAFGVVLYEMLTGQRAFEGDDVSITLAAVLKDDVNWKALPPDLLVFIRDGRLMAQRLDLASRRLTGEPFLAADQVSVDVTSGAIAAAAGGRVLAVTAGVDQGLRRLLWMTAGGAAEETVGAAAAYENPRLSPDGTRLAVVDARDQSDIWVHDLLRGTQTRFTFDPGMDTTPLWSPDGSRIAFTSNRGGVFNIYQKSAGGAGEDELLLRTANPKVLNDWSRDGRYLLYQEGDPTTRSDLWALPLFGDRQPIRLLASPFAELAGAFSPDGRWFAYFSNESGTSQVYIQSFPPSGTKWQVSTVRGSAPRWSPDGKTVYFDQTGTLMAVDLIELSRERFKASAPRPLFTGLRALGPHNYDLSPDGRRFLIVTSPSNVIGALQPITVSFNWMPPVGRQ